MPFQFHWHELRSFLTVKSVEFVLKKVKSACQIMWQNVNKFADRNLFGICQSNFFLSDSKIHMSKTLSYFPSKCKMKFLFCHEVRFNNFLTLMFILCINGPFFSQCTSAYNTPQAIFISRLSLTSFYFCKRFWFIRGCLVGPYSSS